MKTLREFFQKARYSPLRPIIKFGYSVVINIELKYETLRDRFTSHHDKHDCSELTAVIKTFERPKKLQRLIHSIRRTYPTLKIIVVDDSRDPVAIDGVDLITLPYDSGVSAGRSAGLKKVETPYVINLDDDFIFTRKTNLLKAVQYLNHNTQVDLVAGEVAYLPYYIRFDYRTHQLMDYSRRPIYEKGTVIDGLSVYEKCSNFFIARTEKLREVGWDNQLKRLDHADFYTRAYGKIVTVFDPEIELLHTPTHFDLNYLKIRHDYSQDAVVLNKRYPQ